MVVVITCTSLRATGRAVLLATELAWAAAPSSCARTRWLHCIARCGFCVWLPSNRTVPSPYEQPYRWFLSTHSSAEEAQVCSSSHLGLRDWRGNWFSHPVPEGWCLGPLQREPPPQEDPRTWPPEQRGQASRIPKASWIRRHLHTPGIALRLVASQWILPASQRTSFPVPPCQKVANMSVTGIKQLISTYN